MDASIGSFPIQLVVSGERSWAPLGQAPWRVVPLLPLVMALTSTGCREFAMTERAPYSLAQLAWYALRLGSIGFGGPAALAGYMYRDLVQRHSGISEVHACRDWGLRP